MDLPTTIAQLLSLDYRECQKLAKQLHLPAGGFFYALRDRLADKLDLNGDLSGQLSLDPPDHLEYKQLFGQPGVLTHEAFDYLVGRHLQLAAMAARVEPEVRAWYSGSSTRALPKPLFDLVYIMTVMCHRAVLIDATSVAPDAPSAQHATEAPTQSPAVSSIEADEMDPDDSLRIRRAPLNQQMQDALEDIMTRDNPMASPELKTHSREVTLIVESPSPPSSGLKIFEDDNVPVSHAVNADETLPLSSRAQEAVEVIERPGFIAYLGSPVKSSPVKSSPVKSSLKSSPVKGSPVKSVRIASVAMQREVSQPFVDSPNKRAAQAVASLTTDMGFDSLAQLDRLATPNKPRSLGHTPANSPMMLR